MPERLQTTHVLTDRQLVIYRRERSGVWQCRFKIDARWHRATTGEHEYEKAKVKADRLRIEAEVRKQNNLPVITRKFRDVARLAIQRMNDEQASKRGKTSYSDYIRVINDYLIPILGKHHITSIDSSVLNHLDVERIKKMGKAPSKSTLQTHNAALNRVFDEAVIRIFLTDANRPQLDAKGRESDRRPAFELKETQALLAKFEPWIETAKTQTSIQLRLLLRDYVEALLDTGARPGKELLDLKWNQIRFTRDPKTIETGEVDPEDGEPIDFVDFRHSCQMMVSGKTGSRTILGMHRTVSALSRIAKRNYGAAGSFITVFENIAVPSNSDYVFRTADKSKPTSFEHMFENYLKEHILVSCTNNGDISYFVPWLVPR